jgi:hypothetical protein
VPLVVCYFGVRHIVIEEGISDDEGDGKATVCIVIQIL